MTPRRFFCAALIPVLGFCFLTSILVSAQTSLPGGGNSNPSTNPAPLVPPDKDKPSGDDGKDSGNNKPPGPGDPTPEGKETCEDDSKGPEAANPDGTPKAPGSVDLSFSLDACPLEYSVAVGSLRLYFETPEENMGDPVYLKYNSVAGAKISEQSTTNLPAGAVKRFTIDQLSGKPLAFELNAGAMVLKPTGSGASSRARVELRTDTGVTGDPAAATRVRQYRSAGGFMEFSATNGNILRWSGPTGRFLDFPPDVATGTASIGLEVLRDGEKIRQVKSPAGLLDVVPDSDGRGYRVATYLPSEVGSKSGAFYSLAPNARPQKTVHIVHPLGTSKLVSTFTNHSPAGFQDRVRVLTYTYEDTFDGGHEWQLATEADGLTLTSSRHVIPDHDKPGMRRVVREVKDGTGKLLTRKEVVQQFEAAWNGWTDVQEIETPAGDSTLRMVRSYRYGTTPGQNDFRKPNWQMTDTGRVYQFKYDAEGRMIERSSPWLDGADGKLLIEKYAYVPFGPGEVVLPGDERPRTTTFEVGTSGASNNPVLSKSYFAAYNDAANGGCHTVVNEDAATPGSAYGNAANRRIKQVFYASSSAPDSGRLKESVDESGLRTQTSYAARSGGGLIETMTGPLNPAGAAKAGLTRRVRTEKDGANRAMTTREALFDGSTYVDFQEDLNTYATEGQLSNVVRTDLKSGRQRLIASHQWQGDRMISMTSEDGSVKGTNMDGLDRMVTTTTGAIPSAASPLGGAAYPARPTITRTTAGTLIADLSRADWGDRTVTTLAGELTLAESMKADARGRVTEVTDVDNYTTWKSHLRNGLETTVTRPDGGKITTRHYLDGRMKDRTGSGIVPEYYSYIVNGGGGITTIVRLGSINGLRYQSTTVDLLGRTVLQELPGHGGVVSTVTSYAGGSGRMSRIASFAPQVAVRIYEYDTFATLTRQGETVRAAATALDLSAVNDRVQEGELAVINDASGLWQVRKLFGYPNEGAAATTRYLLSESRTKLAGFTGDEIQRQYTVDALGNCQQQMTEERIADRLRIEHGTSNAFSGEAVGVYHGGLLVEQRRPCDTASTRMSYDALGRLLSTKQPRHIHADSIVYAVGENQVTSRNDANGAPTSYTYVPQSVAGAGRIASVTLADSTVRRSAYDLRGNLTYEWGSAVAPVAYGYDGYNQVEYLSTYRTALTGDSVGWPATIGTPDVTHWLREEPTGLLTQKLHADGLGPVYEYDIAGRVTRRTSARNLITDYTYTAWGQPDVTNYHDSTPDVDINYDRMGRKTRESNGVATGDFQYSPTTMLPTLETISYDLDRNGTPELIRQLDRSHDNLRRPTGFMLKDGTTLDNQAIYGYDAYSRLWSASGGGNQASGPANTFFYTYTPNSNLLYQTIGPVHTVTNTWESDRDVLDVKENKAGSSIVSNFDYTVNAIGQRTGIGQTGSAFSSVRSIAWGYDPLGQLTSADSTVTGQDRAYQYDAIGNRKKSADSLTLPVTDNYTANALNQYSVQPVNGGSSISPAYDFDGNATAYPVPVAPSTNSTLVWDAENRLISSTVSGTTTVYQYDAGGRRIAKTTGTTTQLSLYDSWNVIAEYSKIAAAPAALQKTRLWGTDLSGSIQGAGGVGGMLSESSLITSSPITFNTFFPTCDGNGNVSECLATTGAVSAHFEYDSFGRTTIDTDTIGQFSYRFSTKPYDAETGFYYYGYRYYDPMTGRWPSRDPLEEMGGMNLYGFAGNDGVNYYDRLGMSYVGDFMGGFGNEFQGGLSRIFGGAASDVGGVFRGLGDLVGREIDYMGEGPLSYLDRTAGRIDGIYRDVEDINDGLNRFIDDPNYREASNQFFGSQYDDFMRAMYLASTNPECFEQMLRKGLSQATLALLAELGIRGGNAAIKAGLEGLSKMPAGELKVVLKKCSDPKLGGACFVAGTEIATEDSQLPIENISVGDRVLTSSGESASEVDPKDWRKIVIKMPNSECPSDILDIELLRSEEWMASLNCVSGAQIWLDLEEMGLSGWANVESVEECPQIKTGRGRVVLATVTHFNSFVMSLKFAGAPEEFHPTDRHRLYSVTRHDWIPAAQLKIGEELATKTGTILLKSLDTVPGTLRVYNLEVETDHCFFAGKVGVLSHNECGANGPPGPVQGPSPKIHAGGQGKHIPGHNNYEPGRSPLTADPSELGRQAGTGQQVGKVEVGLPGSKERVDFGSQIGEHIDKDTGVSSPTTKGIIHYGGKGIHIIPARP